MSKNIKIYILISFLASLSPLTQHTILPTVINIQNHYSIGYETVIYIFAISTLSMAIMHMLYGTLSDNFGRKNVILIALSVYILISFLIFKLDLNYYSFLLFRFMQTGSSCVGIVLSIAIIKDIAPQKDLFKIISFVMSANMFIPIFSPIIGGFLNENYDWKSINLFYSLAGISMFVITLILFKETNIYKYQGRKRINQEFLILLKDINFYYLIGISLITIFTTFSFISISPYLTITLKKFNSLEFGFFSFFISLGFIIGSLSSGIMKNIDRILLIKIGSFFCLLIYIVIFIYLYFINNFNIFLLFFLISLAAMGKGLIIPSVSGITVNYNKRIAGTALGFLSFIKLIIASLSTIFAGYLVVYSYKILFFIYVILFLICVVLILLFKINKIQD